MSKNLKLWCLSDTCQDSNNLLQQLDTNTLSIDILEALPEEQLQEKFGILTYIMADDKTMIEAMRGQIKILESRKRQISTRMQRTKNFFHQAMKLLDIKKIDCPIVSMKDGQTPKKLVIEDELSLLMNHPEYFINPKPVLNKKLIEDDVLKNGVILEGVKVVRENALMLRWLQ
jgi:hypothetical protein